MCLCPLQLPFAYNAEAQPPPKCPLTVIFNERHGERVGPGLLVCLALRVLGHFYLHAAGEGEKGVERWL